MNKLLLLACAAAALLAGACAVDPASSTEPVAMKEYRTGSNLPKRQGDTVQTISPEEFERARTRSIGTGPAGARGN